MRRHKKEITDRAQIDAIIRESQVCRLAMTGPEGPYIVPLNFGYDGTTLYFHCAKEGQKMDILQANPQVCFEFDLVDELKEGKGLCSWSMSYRSVIGFGTVRFLDEPQEKQNALQELLAQYGGPRQELQEKAVTATAVFCVDIAKITGKQNPPPDAQSH